MRSLGIKRVTLQSCVQGFEAGQADDMLMQHGRCGQCQQWCLVSEVHEHYVHLTGPKADTVQGNIITYHQSQSKEAIIMLHLPPTFSSRSLSLMSRSDVPYHWVSLTREFDSNELEPDGVV